MVGRVLTSQIHRFTSILTLHRVARRLVLAEKEKLRVPHGQTAARATQSHFLVLNPDQSAASFFTGNGNVSFMKNVLIRATTDAPNSTSKIALYPSSE